jgi:DNA processing protein
VVNHQAKLVIINAMTDDKTIWVYAIKTHCVKIGDNQIIKNLDEIEKLAGELKLETKHHESSSRELSLYEQEGINYCIYGSSNYPKAFYELSSPPSIIYYFGDLSKISYKESISIVGTRNASSYGLQVTEAIISKLAQYQVNIISGLARGIDLAGHQAALDHNLKTTAILGSGLKSFSYGGSQRAMFKQLKSNPENLIISEFAPMQPAESWTFSHRNRLIAALSPTTIVVEASLNSGSLITASYAQELKRQILTVPADIFRESFAGCHQLLENNSARGIYNLDSLEGFINLKTKKNYQPNAKLNFEIDLSSKQNAILKCLSKEGTGLDAISIQTNCPTNELLADISTLELCGLITKLKGEKYIKN